MRVSMRCWLWQAYVAPGQGRLEPKHQVFCIQAQKFELYPANNKANRESLCMRMTWSALFFRKKTWHLGLEGQKRREKGRQERCCGRLDRGSGDGNGENIHRLKRHFWGRIGKNPQPIEGGEQANGGTKNKTGISSLGGGANHGSI